MADQIFAKFRRMVGEFDITHEQIDVLKACVEGDEIPENAAKKLTARVEESSTPLDMQQRINGLWTILNDAAVAIPSAQDTIISVLKTIRTFPRVKEPTGEGDGCVDTKDGYIWRELADWASSFADDYNHYGAWFKISPLHTPNSDEQVILRRQAWISCNAYLGRLTATNDEILTMDHTGLEMGDYAIVDTLELEFGEKEPNDLEAAAQLFIHAAPELYVRSKNKYTGRNGWRSLPNRGTYERYKDRNLWHGPDGYSLERWEFWRMRWAVLAGMEGLSDEARAAARHALNAMNEAEG